MMAKLPKLSKILILSKMSPSDRELFWSKVDILSPDDCWLWNGTRNPAGYGRFSAGPEKERQRLMAHRIAKTLALNKEIPPELIVMHMCDNPPCCNPSHLAIATQQENMDDMVMKNRSSVSYGNAKINWAIVDDIRSSEESGIAMSEKYGISKATISEIRNRKIWKEEHRNIAVLPS